MDSGHGADDRNRTSRRPGDDPLRDHQGPSTWWSQRTHVPTIGAIRPSCRTPRYAPGRLRELFVIIVGSFAHFSQDHGGRKWVRSRDLLSCETEPGSVASPPRSGRTDSPELSAELSKKTAKPTLSSPIMAEKPQQASPMLPFCVSADRLSGSKGFGSATPTQGNTHSRMALPPCRLSGKPRVKCRNWLRRNGLWRAATRSPQSPSQQGLTATRPPLSG